MKTRWVPQAVVCMALIWALYPRNPHAYYVFLRVLCSGVFLYLALMAFHQLKQAWVWIFGGLVVLYNPLFSLRLNRPAWTLLNVVTAIVAVASIWILRIGGHEEPPVQMDQEP